MPQCPEATTDKPRLLYINMNISKKVIKMSCRIMLVDDSTFMRNYERKIIEDAGFEVVAEAANGNEAIIMYTQYKPDVVLMDITMPEVNGLVALKTIIGLYPDAKLIMCSAMGQEVYIMDSIEAGAKGFLVKPFQPADLVEAIYKARPRV